MPDPTQAARSTTGPLLLAEASPPARLVSLDAFRGLTVLAMILVNNPGDWGHIYWPLAHAEWHGCTPADLIFPFFLFIVGVSIVYALDGARRDPARHPAASWRVLRRAAVLAGLGLFGSLFLFWDFGTVRIPGVLMRISGVFLVCALVFLKTGWRTQLALLAGILGSYAVLLQVVPVPGIGPANLAPATNLGAWLDRLVFGEAHLWKESRTWDPEGLLGTLPAVGTGLLGLLAGRWLRTARSGPAKARGLLLAGAGAALLGWGWSFWFPLNKALWTSSYVLLTGGLAAGLLAAFYWLCDVRGHRAWALPLRVYGVNAITVFFLSGLVARSLNLWKVPFRGQPAVSVKEVLYQTLFVPAFPDPYLASLAGAAACVLIWLGVLGLMYRRRIIIKV